MCQHGTPNHIADGVNVRHRRLKVIVHGDSASLVYGQASLVQV